MSEIRKYSIRINIGFFIFALLFIVSEWKILGFPITNVLIGFQFLYTILSLKSVETDELGLIVLFGKPVDEVSSGLQYVPFLICRLLVETRNNIQIELPDEPQFVFDGDIKDMPDKRIPAGMVPAIRILFGNPKNKNTNPYDKQMVVKVTPVVTFKIENFIEFVQNIGIIADVKTQLSDLAEAMFANDFAKHTPAEVQMNLDLHAQKLRIAIEEKVIDWGIKIESVYIKPFSFSHLLNEAVVRVSMAEQDALAVAARATGEAEQIMKLAEANRVRVQKEGQAAANARQLLLEAEALGLEKLAEKMKTPAGTLAQQLLVIRTALEKSQYSILSTDSGILGTMTGIKEVLDKMGGKK